MTGQDRSQMRLDVVTIFPDYLAPLDLSLIGKARREGLLDLHVHDLRDFTHDRHRTVDDTPFGGGAGMVMKPQPWAEALDHVLAQAPLDSPPRTVCVSAAPGAEEHTLSESGGDAGVGGAGGGGARVPRLIVPGPGGVPFTQALAHELAEEPWLAFACGRYEGLDERVYEHAAERMPVTIVSLGDYVLNGGEVAVLAIVEAVARLLPGVVGNAESLVEESHEDGLLEYPVYTKPSVWNDDGTSREVPPILLSGNHPAIAAWRHQQRLDRTAARRPDLLHASSALAGAEGLTLATATPADAPELLTLQRAAFVREIEAHGNACFPALTEELDDVVAGLVDWSTLVARSGGRLVASGRGRLLDDGSWEVSRVMVAPDLVGRGIGRALVAAVEGLAPTGATAYRLMVAAGADRTRRMYRKAGYRESREPSTVEGAVVMTKARKREKD